MSRAICPSCAREYAEGSRSCTACGSPLTLKACAHCEAINAIDATCCHQCGAAIAPEAASVEMGAAAPDASVPGARAGAPASLARCAPPLASGPVVANARVAAETASPALDATPVVFAERAEYAQRVFGEQRISHERRMAPAPPPSEALPIERHVAGENGAPSGFARRTAPRKSRRSVHVGSAITLVSAVGAAAYFALDVPLVQRVANDAAGWLDVRAVTAARSDKAPPSPEPPVAVSPSPAPASAAPVAREEPATNASMQRERASDDHPAASSQAEAGAVTPRQTAPSASRKRAQQAQRHGSRSTPPPSASRDALATQRLIERDLGKFRSP